MKITREQLHRAVAAHFEPNPDALGGSFEYPQCSPLGYWCRSVLHDYVTQQTIYGDWQPVNFSTSEDAAARLLDAMPMPYLWRRKDSNGWDCGATPPTGSRKDGYSSDRKLSILLAAKSWLGIEGELEDEHGD